MLTKTFTKEIEELLNAGGFAVQDFSITSKKNYSVTEVKIKYLYQEFTFIGKIYDTGQFEADYSPGAVLVTEKVSFKDKNSFLDSIYNWIENINSEFRSYPFVRRMDEQDEILNQLKAKIDKIENQDKTFTNQEIADFNQKLQALKEALIKEIEEGKEDTAKEINQLSSEIESLKAQLYMLTKKNWALSLSTKIYLWSHRNPLAMRTLAGATKQLLPEEAQVVLSDEVLDQLLPVPQNNKK